MKIFYSPLILVLLIFYSFKVFSQYPPDVRKFTIEELVNSGTLKNQRGFFNNKTMWTRIFEIRANTKNTFLNRDDGIYYILDGKGTFNIDNHSINVVPGSIIYIGKKISHQFLNLQRKLIVLALFSKADQPDTDSTKVFSLKQIENKRVKNENIWEPFVRNKNMTLGLYMLPKVIGGDSILTHKVDELNVVTRGSAKFSIDDYTMDVKRGDIIFVGKGKGHYFHNLTDDFDVLIFWEKKSVSQ